MDGAILRIDEWLLDVDEKGELLKVRSIRVERGGSGREGRGDVCMQRGA